MPAVTRSATKQPKLEEIKGTETGDKDPNDTRKRKSPDISTSTSKKQKGKDGHSRQKEASAASSDKGTIQHNNADQGQDAITINRAPVLELWASCVTNFIYPSIPWETCLSVGSAISTITAVAKGRSIGTMEKPGPDEAEARRRERQRKAEDEQLEDIEVMGFHLRLKDGKALVGDKPKPGNESALSKKFGQEQYEMAKGAFQDALGSWKGRESELDREAFKMYEEFRPTVPPGQKGWGRKGQLNLENVKGVVSA
ncbi:hypothetical protein KC340_g11873 [Hortaea werneckii]|nr:hypothetical protein KC342_g12191 [Hortaea werneckii]KAI7079873.1 hypothetical protein KC339_g13544 [Hortaea werneckii]KAI7216276.1 hypothetical protein KC365_g13330 [Hortaea werneckii]KAI7305890.1 hypothetical protein KC340_g11873 [Hortaea werneckii]KAI7388037.1 hypothetical protein KC328_g9142 [Hortaea werneckii]